MRYCNHGGGDGGYVYHTSGVNISKDVNLTSTIAEIADRTGTTLTYNNTVYSCDQSGSTAASGGSGGSLPKARDNHKWADQSSAIISECGENGVKTPYGYVGSGGGGGAVCNGRVSATNGTKGGYGAGSGNNHRNNGGDAKNYGCGGGGGAFCGYVANGYDGGKGKKGCVIIAYKAKQNSCDEKNIV